MRRWRNLAVLALVGCSTTPSPRLVIHLVLPDSPNAADAGVTSLQIAVGWDGGDAGLTEPFQDAGFEVPLPAGPVDVEVTGLDATGVSRWRGMAHGVEVPAGSSGSPAVATLFFGPIGAFASFASVAAMPPLAGSAAVSWPDGRVVISGGIAADGTLDDGVWVYDPRTVQVTLLGTSMEPRAHHLSLPISGLPGAPGVLLAGGDVSGGGVTDSVELFWPDGGATLASLSAPQREPRGALAGDGRVLIGCGFPATRSLDAYVPSDYDNNLGSGGTWLLPSSCELGQVTWMPALASFVVGDGSDGGLSLANLDDGLDVGPWAATSEIRTRFGAVASGSAVLQFGGLAGGAPQQSYELDCDAGRSAYGTLLNEPRSDFGWVTTPDGGVLVVGGAGSSGAVNDADIFNPASPSLATQASPLSRPRIHPAIADISGYGAALVVSGEDADGGPVAGLEIYTY